MIASCLRRLAQTEDSSVARGPLAKGSSPFRGVLLGAVIHWIFRRSAPRGVPWVPRDGLRCRTGQRRVTDVNEIESHLPKSAAMPFDPSASTEIPGANLAEGQGTEITGADIASVLRLQLEQIADEVTSRFDQFYAHSGNAALDGSFAHGWCVRELIDFFDCIAHEGQSNGNYASWVGDAVCMHYDRFSPLANRIEMVQLYAEVCVGYVWEAFVGDSAQLNEAIAVFGRCVENLLTSDIEGFTHATLEPGTFARAWRLGPHKSIDPTDASKMSALASTAELSPRQLQIIRFISEGRSNGEIAGELRISVNTVKNHLAVIFDKLNVDNRTELALLAVREGLGVRRGHAS